MKIRRSFAVVGFALLGISLIAPPAAADFTCTLDEGAGTLTVTFDQQATVKRSGDVILVKGQPCEGATVFNTDLIRFFAGKPNKHQDMKVDLLGGLFAPGLTDEGDGSSEIEFEVDTGIGDDNMTVTGTAANDYFVRGLRGVNLNPQELVKDLDVANQGDVRLFGLSGDDLLSTNGGAATGKRGQAALLGGEGDDTFIAAGGGESSNTYDGGDGYDLLDYSKKTCSIEASSAVGDALEILASCRAEDRGDNAQGIDELIATRFDDTLSGTDADEVLRGKQGDDTLLGKGGNDLLDGGADTDLCRGGDGDDIRIRCE